MVDIIPKTENGKEQNECLGIVVKKDDGTLDTIYADYTVLASGGIGGIYRYSTNYRHLTGDAVAVSIRHNIHYRMKMKAVTKRVFQSFQHFIQKKKKTEVS